MADSGERYITLLTEIQGSPFVIFYYHAPNVENEQLKLLKCKRNVSFLLMNLKERQKSGRSPFTVS